MSNTTININNITVNDVYNSFPIELFQYIMKYVGATPSAKALEHTCKVYKHFIERYLHFEEALCPHYLYSYLHFRPHKYLTRQNHYDVLYTIWLSTNDYLNFNIIDENFIKKYENSYIYYTEKAIEDGNEDVMDFIANDKYAFIIACMYCEFISNSFIFRQTHDIGTTYDFCDLLYDFQMPQNKVLANLSHFQMGNFDKICSTIDYLNDTNIDIDEEYADDNSYGSWG